MNDFDLIHAAATIAGASTVRAGDGTTDAVDAVVPRVIITPDTADDLRAVLAWASAERLQTLVRGAGTKHAWGRPPDRIDVLLDMRRMNRVLAHEHGDLTATIEAGASLHDVNAALAVRGQFLPLDPPFAGEATIGGVLATNDSGPLRHRYGTPRDVIIGIRLATTDGVLAKAGGQVVKNVAGYDLSKLASGSFGGLAVIVSATFKLSPLPETSRTVVATTGDAGRADAWVQRMVRSQLEPQTFEVDASDEGIALKLRFASIAESVAAQVAQARALVDPDHPGVTRELSGADEHQLWNAHARRVWIGGAVVRVNWMPASLAAAIDTIRKSPAGVRVTLVGRAALGAGLLRIEGDDDAQVRAIDAIRASTIFRHVVIVSASTTVKRRVDVWGDPGDRAPILASLKRAFDPSGILNAGRGPL